MDIVKENVCVYCLALFYQSTKETLEIEETIWHQWVTTHKLNIPAAPHFSNPMWDVV